MLRFEIIKSTIRFQQGDCITKTIEVIQNLLFFLDDGALGRSIVSVFLWLILNINSNNLASAKSIAIETCKRKPSWSLPNDVSAREVFFSQI